MNRKNVSVILYMVVMASQSHISSSFVITSGPSFRHTSEIFMAKQGRSSKSQKPNAKKSKNIKTGPSAGKKKDKNSKTSSEGPKKPPVHRPPWQIMSEKDIKANIELEKHRRESIRNGEMSSSVTSLLPVKKGDINASSALIKPIDRQLYNWKRFSDKEVLGMSFEGAYLGSNLPPRLGVPEVAFLGRSNVGKSSLLNCLGKKSPDFSATARVGQTPGATAAVNLYTLQSKSKRKPLIGFADLPGFGYAKLSKEVKEDVEKAAEIYLGKRKELSLGILLVDIRRVPSDDDRAVLAALYDMGIPIIVVATKKDKLKSENALSVALEEIRYGLGLPIGQPLCVSSATGENVKQLWSIIMDACEDKVLELKDKAEGGTDDSSTDVDDDDDYIQLDDDGNFIEDDEDVNEGYEWIQEFAKHDTPFSVTNRRKLDKPKEISAESRQKMEENRKIQEAANEAMKLKHLKKKARQMERSGDV